MAGYLSLLFTLQFDIDSGSSVPLQSDALGGCDDHKVAHFLHVERGVGFHSHGLAFYKLQFVVISCCCKNIWTASSEFGTYSLCEQRRFRRACASAQSRQNLRCSLIQAVSQEEPSDRKPDPWSLWMAGHAQLKFVMTECSKTQIPLTGLIYGMKSFKCRDKSGPQFSILSWLICLERIL